MALGATPDTAGAWLLIVLSQCAAVLGDAFGQRTVRVVHKHSRRRMIMSFVLVSSVQVFVVLGLLQLVLPPSITGDVYIGGEPSTCYVQYFDEGCCPTDGPSCHCVVNCTAAAASCTPAPCPSQGPGSMFRSLRQHPFLLINGAANTVYYFAESMLYREPLGLVLLVVSSLSATVFFKPVGSIFHLPNSHISPGVLVMGIGGALLCVVEKVSFKARGGGGEGGAGDAGSDAAPGTALDVCVSSFETSGGSMVDRPPSPPRGFAGFTDAMGHGRASRSTYARLSPFNGSMDVDSTKPTRARGGGGGSRPCDCCHVVMAALRILPPFLVLSLCYCLWFVFMRFFNDLYRVNAWGFNAYDQVTLPAFVFPVMALLSCAGPAARGMVETTEDGKQETFIQSFKHAWAELTESWGTFWTVFAYRGIINLRAVVYSYLAIFYDLDVVYVELTLVRVLTSWVGAIILCWCVPSFINTRPEEKARIVAPENLALKAVGTGLVTAALILLSSSS